MSFSFPALLCGRAFFCLHAEHAPPVSFVSGLNLPGTIPVTISRLSALTGLLLNANSLTGTIPTQIGALQRLRFLRLNGNRLTGTLPREIENLLSLTSIFTNGNNLVGPVYLPQTFHPNHICLLQSEPRGEGNCFSFCPILPCTQAQCGCCRDSFRCPYSPPLETAVTTTKQAETDGFATSTAVSSPTIFTTTKTLMVTFQGAPSSSLSTGTGTDVSSSQPKTGTDGDKSTASEMRILTTHSSFQRRDETRTQKASEVAPGRSDSNSPPVLAFVGVAVGSIVALFGIGATLLCVYWRREKSNASEECVIARDTDMKKVAEFDGKHFSHYGRGFQQSQNDFEGTYVDVDALAVPGDS